MDQSIMQLYPLPAAERELEGLYLAHDIRQHDLKSGRAFVYANFVTSIDGRIAVPRSNGNGLVVPKNIANKRDWRLFQELALRPISSSAVGAICAIGLKAACRKSFVWMILNMPI